MHGTALILSALFLFLGACNGDDRDKGVELETLFPANDEVGSWVEDTSEGKPGVEVAQNEGNDVWDLVNGDAELFLNHDLVAIGWEHYTDGTYTLDLRIYQMPDKATAKDTYVGALTEDAGYSGSNWEDVALGAAGRVANTGTTWWFNTYKDVYCVEASGIRPNDDPGKTAGQAFVAAVLEKIP